MATLEHVEWTESGEEIVCFLVDEIFDSAARVIAEKAIQEKVQPFTLQWVLTSLEQGVNCQLVQVDDGDDPVVDDVEAADSAALWSLDEEPAPSPVDTWATHSIPVHHALPEPKAPTSSVNHSSSSNREKSSGGSGTDTKVIAKTTERDNAVVEESVVDKATEEASKDVPLKATSKPLKQVMGEKRRFRSASVSIVSRKPILKLGQQWSPSTSAATNDFKELLMERGNDELEEPIFKAHLEETLNAVAEPHAVQSSNNNKSKYSNTEVKEEAPEPARTAAINDILNKQTERELASIARISRETNGLFAYDFKGKLIPVKKVDGDVLPQYSFQTKISVSTVSRAAAASTSCSDETLEAKGKTAKGLALVPHPPKTRKTATRKIKAT